MAKRKAKPYTLAGFWKNINTVVPKCLNGSTKTEQKKSLSELTKIVDEVNSSPIPHSIGDLFVKPYLEAEDFSVNFIAPPKTKPVEDTFKPVTYEKEEEIEGDSVVSIDSLELFNYVGLFRIAVERKENEEDISDFKEKRQNAFMNEMAKLPDPYFVYLAVLQEVAYCNDVVSVEDREGNFHKSDAGFYLSLLWAFKEFEAFYLRAQNRNLRADYGIIWHEGEWVQDSKRSRGYV